MVCRIPESVGYVPMLSVRAEGLEPALFYWAGDKRPREDVGGFESVELDRRYIVEVAKGQDHAWLRQLFPPSLHRLARVEHSGRLRLPARRRSLHLRVPAIPRPASRRRRGRRRAPRPARRRRRQVRRAGFATRCSRRPDVSWGGTSPDSAAAHTGRASGAQARPAARHGAEDRRGGRGRRQHRGLRRPSTGWRSKDPAEFHANHIRLPLPGTAERRAHRAAARHRAGRRSRLARVLGAVDMQRNYNAVVIEGDRELPRDLGRFRRRHRAGVRRRARAGGARGGARARGYGISTAGPQGVRLPRLGSGLRGLADRRRRSRLSAPARPRSCRRSEPRFGGRVSASPPGNTREWNSHCY